MVGGRVRQEFHRKQRLCHKPEPAGGFAAMMKSAYRAAKKANPNAKKSRDSTPLEAPRRSAGRKGSMTRADLAFCDTVDSPFLHAARHAVSGGCVRGGVPRRGRLYPQTERKDWKARLYVRGTGGERRRRQRRQQHALCRTVQTHPSPGRTKRITLPWRTGMCGICCPCFVFVFRRSSSIPRTATPDFSTAPNFLVLFCADGSPHPMLVAHSAMARRLETMKFVRIKKLRDDLWACLFSNGKKIGGGDFRSLQRRNTRVDCSLKQGKAVDLYGNALSSSDGLQQDRCSIWKRLFPRRNWPVR